MNRIVLKFYWGLPFKVIGMERLIECSFFSNSIVGFLSCNKKKLIINVYLLLGRNFVKLGKAEFSFFND